MSKRQTLRSRWNEQPDLDCTTCWKRKECERAEEGTFCTQWARTEPEAREPDPNDQWRAGEPAEFEG